jgi:hypothetical protein
MSKKIALMSNPPGKIWLPQGFHSGIHVTKERDFSYLVTTLKQPRVIYNSFLLHRGENWIYDFDASASITSGYLVKGKGFCPRNGSGNIVQATCIGITDNGYLVVSTSEPKLHAYKITDLQAGTYTSSANLSVTDQVVFICKTNASVHEFGNLAFALNNGTIYNCYISASGFTGVTNVGSPGFPENRQTSVPLAPQYGTASTPHLPLTDEEVTIKTILVPGCSTAFGAGSGAGSGAGYGYGQCGTVVDNNGTGYLYGLDRGNGMGKVKSLLTYFDQITPYCDIDFSFKQIKHDSYRWEPPSYEYFSYILQSGKKLLFDVVLPREHYVRRIMSDTLFGSTGRGSGYWGSHVPESPPSSCSAVNAYLQSEISSVLGLPWGSSGGYGYNANWGEVYEYGEARFNTSRNRLEARYEQAEMSMGPIDRYSFPADYNIIEYNRLFLSGIGLSVYPGATPSASFNDMLQLVSGATTYGSFSFNLSAFPGTNDNAYFAIWDMNVVSDAKNYLIQMPDYSSQKASTSGCDSSSEWQVNFALFSGKYGFGGGNFKPYGFIDIVKKNWDSIAYKDGIDKEVTLDREYDDVAA